jgi:hypothetical protein
MPMTDLVWIAFMDLFPPLVSFFFGHHNLLPSLHHSPFPDLHEARAVLLGRLGRHDQALETYVYRLRDFLKAEE